MSRWPSWDAFISLAPVGPCSLPESQEKYSRVKARIYLLGRFRICTEASEKFETAEINEKRAMCQIETFCI